MALTQISTAGVKDDAVTAGKIPANAVGSSELADNAVDTAAIADDAVTTSKFENISTNRILGRVDSGTGQLQHLTSTEARTVLNVENGATNSPTTTINNNADNRVITGSGTANTLNGESNVVIDSSGRVLVGSTSSTASDSVLQVRQDGSGSNFEVIRSYNDSGTPARVRFANSRGTAASPAVVANGDDLGELRFTGHDGTDYNNTAASIIAAVDGGAAANDMPGRLEFLTTADGANTPTERMRIDSSGNVGINTTSISNRLEIANSTSDKGILIKSTGNNYHTICGDANRSQATDNILRLDAKWNGTVVGRIRLIAGNDTTNKDDGIIAFDTASGGAMGERMRILSSGGLTFNGDTAAANAFDDYEEGNLSWHLAKTNAPGQGSNNGSLVKYVKVGRLVHISGRIRTDSVDGSGSHSFIFQSGSTLPFTPETSGTSVIGHIRSQDQSDGSLTASIAWASGSTTLYIYTIDSGSDYSADSNNVGAKTQTNLVMTFSLTYRANS